MDALFVIDPPGTLSPLVDSTHVMVTEALRRGHRPFGATADGLILRGAEALAHAAPLALEDGPAPARLRFDGPPKLRPLGGFELVLMRKDPPFDENYLTATWCLDRAPADTLVLNDPAGLRELNEKLSILAFPDLIPTTHLVRRTEDLRAALKEFGGKMVVKPVFGFGGREVLRAFDDDPNLSTLFELATREGTRWTVAQAFVENASEGDKRVLLVDGAPIGAVLRVPAEGEARSNFHAGGSPCATELTERDLEICRKVGPLLSARGQFFVGLDIIGGYLTEINVTSPTGMQEINALHGLANEHTMQAMFWRRLEARLSTPTHT